MGLKDATTNELFTELMNRIPVEQRFCLFVSVYDSKYCSDNKYVTSYRLHEAEHGILEHFAVSDYIE